MHSWATDPDAQQLYINEALALVQKGAINELDLFFRRENPFAHNEDYTRTVVIESILHETENTYIVNFITDQKTVTGHPFKKYRWTALITITEFNPNTNNPLGLYVTHFDIRLLGEVK